jgi:hypothetical protein
MFNALRFSPVLAALGRYGERTARRLSGRGAGERTTLSATSPSLCGATAPGGPPRSRARRGPRCFSQLLPRPRASPGRAHRPPLAQSRRSGAAVLGVPPSAEPIQDLIDHEGCDLEADVLPVVRELLTAPGQPPLRRERSADVASVRHTSPGSNFPSRMTPLAACPLHLKP